MGVAVKPCVCDANKLTKTEREEAELIEARKWRFLETLWNFKTDKFHLKTRPDLLKLVDGANEKPVEMTKRMILSQVASFVFDPSENRPATTVAIGTKLGRRGVTHSSG